MRDPGLTVCPFCRSSRIIKHGRTTTNNQRFRCRYCHKTWTENKKPKQIADFGGLTEAYLSGLSYRELHAIFPSSPTRINQKIREYLEGCSHWEEYLDICSPKHDSRLIHLVGKRFACTTGEKEGNCMFLALAIDALSTVVLGYEIGENESTDLWITLLDRMNCRGIISPTFMSYGSKPIEDALKVVFPYSTSFNNFTRVNYDNKLKNKLYYSIDSRKLILEAIQAYDQNPAHNLEEYLIAFKDRRMRDIVLNSKERFINRLKERVAMRTTTRFEGLLGAFQSRFQKFHSIKDDPQPLINGWIGWWMLIPLPIGFSRLSLYLQRPCITQFKHLKCGTAPIPLELETDSFAMKTFVVELAVRSLHIPIKG
jgi:hypothetical protein